MYFAFIKEFSNKSQSKPKQQDIEIKTAASEHQQIKIILNYFQMMLSPGSTIIASSLHLKK